MKTTIRIHDNHSSAEIELDKNVIIHVKNGKCPVENLLKGLDTNCSAERIAHRILHQWLTIYDGSPEISRPTVEVIRESEQAVASI